MNKKKKRKDPTKECYYTSFVAATGDIEQGVILSLLFHLTDNDAHPKWSQTKIIELCGLPKNHANALRLNRNLKSLKKQGYIDYKKCYYNNLIETEFTITPTTYKIYLLSINDNTEFLNQLSVITQRFEIENNTVNAINEAWKAKHNNL